MLGYTGNVNAKCSQRYSKVEWTTGDIDKVYGQVGQKSHAFLQNSKKITRGSLTEECEIAFKKIKETLVAPTMLTKPDPGETLYLHLAIADEVISVALIKDDNKV